jgi:hypothetical protein
MSDQRTASVLSPIIEDLLAKVMSEEGSGFEKGRPTASVDCGVKVF